MLLVETLAVTLVVTSVTAFVVVMSVTVLFQGEQEARAEAVVLGCGAKGTSEGASATTTMATFKALSDSSNTLDRGKVKLSQNKAGLRYFKSRVIFQAGTG